MCVCLFVFVYIYIYIYIYIYMRSWSNSYWRRKWTRWHNFKSLSRLLAFYQALISFWKVWIQLFSLLLWVDDNTEWALLPWYGNCMRRKTINSVLLNASCSYEGGSKYVHVYIYVCVCAFVYIYVCICLCKYVYIYIYMHLYTCVPK